jgi:Glycosidases
MLNNDPLWFKDAIIYEVPVRAFADSNADGIGDFRGLTEKLDYLQNLGVTAIWVLPFFSIAAPRRRLRYISLYHRQPNLRHIRGF